MQIIKSLFGGKKLRERIVKLQNLVVLYDQYLKFITEENQGVVAIAYVHGWRCEQKSIDKGIEYRKKIDELKEMVGFGD